MKACCCCSARIGSFVGLPLSVIFSLAIGGFFWSGGAEPFSVDPATRAKLAAALDGAVEAPPSLGEALDLLLDRVSHVLGMLCGVESAHWDGADGAVVGLSVESCRGHRRGV